MSLHQLANHMSAQGRGRDSTLVHMTPREVSGLQSLAMAHGGTLTINPETGLPEAGFLDSILPTLLGGAATFLSGGAITPFMAALGVGGLTALTSKDLGKGLMAGLGAYGGAGIMEGLVGFGAADIGEKAISSAAADATAAGLTNQSIMTDTTGVMSNPYATAMQKGVGDRMAGASYSDKLKAGFSKALSNPGDAFNAIGGGSMFKGAAMLGAPLLSALATQDQTSVPTAEQIKFDPRYANINISRQQRPYQPDTGSSGERRYFGNTYVTQYADGGAVSNDGIEHFTYGGGTIDPTYDYSGYGPRSNSSGMRPIAYAEAAKPDFVGADGKTYRYDPIKKSWYVIKEAETKDVNAGVKTLMNDGAGGQDRAPSPFNPIANNGLFASIWGRTTQAAAPVVEKSTYSTLAQIQQNQTQMQQEQDAAMQAQADREANSAQAARSAESARYSGLSGLQARQAEIDAAIADKAASDKAASDKQAASNAREDALVAREEQAQINADIAQEKQTHINLTDKYEQTLLDASNRAMLDAEAQEKGFIARQDEADAAVVAGDSAARDAALMGKSVTASIFRGDDPSVFSSSSFTTEAAEARQAREAQAAQVAQEARHAKETQQAQQAQEAQQAAATAAAANQAAVDAAAFEGAQTAADNGGGGGGGGTYGGPGDAGFGGGSQAFVKGGMTGRYSQGGLGSLGGYSDGGRLLRGPGDGVSDSIPATVGDRQPARLADGEFVVPARIVSELGNGSTEAGARALYKMMDRIQANRRKTTGKNSVAVNSKSHKYLPA